MTKPVDNGTCMNIILQVIKTIQFADETSLMKRWRQKCFFDDMSKFSFDLSRSDYLNRSSKATFLFPLHL